MKVDVYMPIFIGDYLRDTPDLTTEEHGAYFLIMMAMWTAGGSLPERKLAAVARISPDRWPAIWETLSRFFTIEDGKATQSRLSKELGRAVSTREQARENGLRGGRPATQTKPDGKPENNRPVNPLVNQTRNPGKTSSPSPPDLRSQPQIPDSLGSGSRVEISEAAPDGTWTAYRWLQAFKVPHRDKYGREYGGGEADAKAQGALADALAAVSRDERLFAQSRASQMIAEFLAQDDKPVVTMRHSFSFFVGRWNALRIPSPEAVAANRPDPPARKPRELELA